MSQPLEKYHKAVECFRREFILAMLAAHGGNRTRTARTLGLQRTYLLRMIRELGLKGPAAETRAISTEETKSKEDTTVFWE